MSYFTVDPDPIMIFDYPEARKAAIVKISEGINKIIHKDGAVYIKDYNKFTLSDSDSSDSDSEVDDDDISHEGMDYDMMLGDRRKDLDLNASELKELLDKKRIESLGEKLKTRLMQI